MKYMGSKDKISSYIKEFIDLNRLPNQTYVELFCGGCNMIDKIKGKRIAADNNKYLIAMWQGLQNDFDRPKEITKTMYDRAKLDFQNKNNHYFSDALIGWIGFLASFNGKFFNGYASEYPSDRKTKTGEIRNYTDESIRNIEKQIQHLKEVKFVHANYWEVKIPKESVIYLDAPYIGTTEYKTGAFNHSKYYDFIEQKQREGHKIFISEYYMPADRFEMIWQKQVNCGMSAGNPQNKIESLFIPKGQKIFKQLKLF